MKSLIKGLVFSTVLASAALINAAEPYDSIKVVPYEPYYIENGWILSNIAVAQGTTVFIDIDSPQGEVARFIASNTDSSVKVYSVNSWTEELSFQKFLSNVIHENLSERIIPLRMTSDEAERALDVVSEFIYIDCNVNDITNKILGWVTHLSEHGIIAGNRWDLPSVELAVVNAAVELNLAIHLDQNFWYLKKD